MDRLFAGDLLRNTKVRLTLLYTLSAIGVIVLYAYVDAAANHISHPGGLLSNFFTASFQRLVITQFVLDTEHTLWLLVLFLPVCLIGGYGLATISLLPLARAVSRQKRFMADAAHELRTPLAAMKTEAEVALLDRNDGDRRVHDCEHTEVLRSSIEEIDRMTGTIKNLLRLSYFDDPAPQLTFAETNLADVLRESIAGVNVFALKKSIAIRHEIPETLWMRGNAFALGTMAANLLNNAIAYTPDGGTVTVRARQKGNRICLIIADTGAGISQKDLAHIFEPFYRGDKARTGGNHSGLGLSIVKEVVDQHKGYIRIQSTLGHGTQATVIFQASGA